jgi:peptide/nickel transport system substrate-binding protein
MSYWNTYLQRRLSRRTALKASAAGAGIAALSLAGCGGGDSGGDDGGDATGLVSKPVDTTSQKKPGGIMALIQSNDPASFDGIGGNAGNAYTNSLHAHSRLTKYVPGKYPNQPDGSVEADAASSWEITPDATQVTFKLRPNMKFDPRPPTNNRPMTAADVKFTWERFSTVSQGRTDLVNSTNPEAPVTSVTTPDASTVVFKLAYPYAPFMIMLPYYRYLSIQPVELEQYAFRSELRGTGPWRLTSYTPSAKIEYRKNPDWYDASKVALDGIDYFIVTEYATQLAQFRSGNLWTFALRQEDILPTKRDLPNTVLQSTGVFTRSFSPYTSFGGGGSTGAIFKDKRVRQAMSMLLDRDLIIDTVYNVSGWEKEGLPVPSRWNSHVPAGIDQYWVDPQGKDMGEGAKYFKFDPAEAKKLLRAAGHNGAIEAIHQYVTNAYGPSYLRYVEMLRGMWESEGDFKFRVEGHDYGSDWVPNYHQGQNKFEGVVTGTISTLPDFDGNLMANFHSIGAKSWVSGPLADSKNDQLIVNQRRELDPKKRAAIIQEWDRYAATEMFTIQSAGEALSFNLAWPWFGNRGVYNAYDAGSEATEQYVHVWYDASKKTG